MRVGRIMAMVGTTLSLMTGPVMASAGLSSQPAEHSSLQRISVQVEGSGKDVVLIPSLASSRKVWDDLVPKLRQSYRLHLVELAGFAGSPAVSETKGKVIAPAVEEIADYIHSQRIQAPVIIGHSLGGEAALMLGARHPDQVGRLLIVDALPFYSLLVDPSATTETATAPAAVMRDSLMAASAEQNEAMQTASIARLVKNEAFRPGLVADSIRSDRRTVADAVYELMVTDLRPELSRITVPVEVVYAYDPMYGVPSSSVDAMFHQAYTSARDIRLKRIDGSFHFVMLDQPEKFARTALTFLSK